VEGLSALLFGEISIDESWSDPDPEAAAALLAKKAVETGIARFASVEQIEAFLARVAFASQHGAIAALGPETVEGALRSMAVGLKSFGELEIAARDGGLLRALSQQLLPAARRLLDEIAPELIRLARGRQLPVHYDAGQPPWIASRLQDFFGMREVPALARGRVPVVVRLLAPNQRPVQMTSDLAGFWERLYPQVRKELARRYPKHAWPENPYLVS
jgi:ATP-dependent helicase HrpB